MATIAELRVPTDEFALRDTFAEVPDAVFELVQVVVHDTHHAIPYLWAMTDDFDGMEAALRDDSSVKDASLVERLDGEYLYRMRWVYRIRILVHIIVEEGATILNARGRDDRWFFRVLFPDRDALSETHDFCEDSHLGVEVTRVYELDRTRSGRFGLTEEQYLTVMLALDRGYYDIPRKTDIQGLADELGLSHQAVSERLRRGHRNFVKNGLGWGTDNARQVLSDELEH